MGQKTIIKGKREGKKIVNEIVAKEQARDEGSLFDGCKDMKI